MIINKESYKFPQNCASNLIDYFLIIGYDTFTNDIPMKKIVGCSKDGKNYEYLYINQGNQVKPTFPTILNNIPSLTNTKKIVMLKEDFIIQQIFPSPPPIIQESTEKDTFQKGKEDPFFAFGFAKLLSLRNKEEPIVTYNVVFSFNNQTTGPSKKQYYGYAYVFYELKGDLNFPKAFCVISEYPCFTFYKKLLKSLVLSLKRESKVIPLEITIFNILNYLPIPTMNPMIIQFNKNFDFTFSEKEEPIERGNKDLSKSMHITSKSDLVFNNINGKENDILQKIELHQNFFFPYFDFPIIDIFKILPPKTIIKILFFQVLEFDMIFFSENLELLNIIMYITSKLTFPFDNNNYSKNIYSISKEALKNNRTFFINQPFRSILGINSKYDPSLLQNKNMVSVDIGNNVIIVDQKIPIWELYTYFANIVDENDKNSSKKKNKQQTSFLKNLIKKTISSLENILNNSKLDKQKGVDFENILLNSERCNNDSENFQIQNIFFNFILELLKVFYSFYSFESRTKNLLMKYKKINATMNRYDVEVHENFENFLMQEQLFFKLFKNTDKYFLFFQQFFEKKGNLGAFFLPFKFCEIFLLIKQDEDNINYFQMMYNFYSYISKKSNPDEISFEKFHKYYLTEWRHFFYNEMKDNNSIFKEKTIDNAKSIEENDIKKSFSYIYSLLNQNLLTKYVLQISNLDQEKIDKLFPFKYVTKYTQIKDDEIFEFVYSSYLQQNFINVLLMKSLFLVILIVSNQSELEKNINYYLKYILKEKKQLIYIIYSLMINFSYSLNKIRQNYPKYNISKEVKFYQIFISLLREEKKIPTGALLEILKKVYVAESKNTQIIKIENEICDNVKPNTKDLKTSKKYTIIISGKFTQSKEEIKKYILELASINVNDEDLFIPYLNNKESFFMDLLISESTKVYSSEIFSPLKLFNLLIKLAGEWPGENNEKSNKKENKKLLTSIISNLIFYFDSYTDFSKINIDLLFDFLKQKNS